MTERPILFSGEMVRAIRDWRKWKTRRVVQGARGAFWDHGAYVPRYSDGEVRFYEHGSVLVPHAPGPRCPYGEPGDRLWVKETWRAAEALDRVRPVDLPEGAAIRYECDGAIEGKLCHPAARPRVEWGRIRQSIFMRRWMSRLLLEIIEVRVERLGALDEREALAEGCGPRMSLGSYNVLVTGGQNYTLTEDHVGGIPRPGDASAIEGRRVEYVQHCPARPIGTAVESFRTVWDRINAKRAPWSANPWVWVIEFRRLN